MQTISYAAGLARFRSGGVWLIVDNDRKLNIVSTTNRDSRLEQGAKRVVLGVDVWEHAYYLRYQNRGNGIKIEGGA